MPTYDYACDACGGFEALRSLSQRNEPAACPDCTSPSPRVFASAPRLACLDSTTRRAIETNERAAHEPVSSKDYGGYSRLRHSSGCGCCSTSSKKRSVTVTATNGNKMFPTKRPWMISH